MKTVWHREMERAAETYRQDASSRRRLSKHDPVADTLEYIAADLEERASRLADPTALRSVEEYAAEHNVAPQTVRNWIHAGELESVSDAKGFKVPAAAIRHRRRPSRVA
jgi:hypothetical protein